MPKTTIRYILQPSTGEVYASVTAVIAWAENKKAVDPTNGAACDMLVALMNELLDGVNRHDSKILGVAKVSPSPLPTASKPDYSDGGPDADFEG
jgi:hypothetical protein